MRSSTWDRVREGVGFRLIQLGHRLRKVRGIYPITKPIDPTNVEVLADPAFRKSVDEVADLTILDTPRLANLWQLCALTDPKGHILEIGSYKGGGALHLSNCGAGRKVIICDSFQGFEKLDANLDKSFHSGMFKDNRKEAVAALFTSRGRKHEIIDGFFPASCAGKTIGPVSFVHLDADIYKSTIESLTYLEKERVLLDQALIVLDDYCREAQGVNQAVAEFISVYPRWSVFPLFPGQGLMVPKTWFD